MLSLYEIHKKVEEEVWPFRDWPIDQYKSSYHDWTVAFKSSIRKNAQLGGRLYVGLSSGYDSGAIVCELINQTIPFTAISIVSDKEDMDVLEKRWEILERNHIKVIKEYWCQETEERVFSLLDEGDITPYIFTIWSHSGHLQYVPMCDDSGALKTVRVSEIAQMNSLESCLTGQGSDEIISDYGYDGKKHFPHSNFGGLFGEQFKPQWNFYGSTQRSYLMYIHIIGNHFGLNAFHPFLDKDVVQEFLSLTPELKNRFYKAPIHNFLTENNFPFSEGVKIGF